MHLKLHSRVIYEYRLSPVALPDATFSSWPHTYPALQQSEMLDNPGQFAASNFI